MVLFENMSTFIDKFILGEENGNKHDLYLHFIYLAFI